MQGHAVPKRQNLDMTKGDMRTQAVSCRLHSVMTLHQPHCGHAWIYTEL